MNTQIVIRILVFKKNILYKYRILIKTEKIISIFNRNRKVYLLLKYLLLYFVLKMNIKIIKKLI